MHEKGIARPLVSRLLLLLLLITQLLCLKAGMIYLYLFVTLGARAFDCMLVYYCLMMKGGRMVRRR
jgi:hypothetical protein